MRTVEMALGGAGFYLVKIDIVACLIQCGNQQNIARFLAFFQFFHQPVNLGKMLLLDKQADDVQFDVFKVGGQLHTADCLYVFTLRGMEELRQARHGVMVGERDCAKPDFFRAVDELGGRPSTV